MKKDMMERNPAPIFKFAINKINLGMQPINPKTHNVLVVGIGKNLLLYSHQTKRLLLTFDLLKAK